MQPVPVVLRVVRVRKARELERSACEHEAVITRDPLLARVDDAHTKQLTVILIRERQELRHGQGGCLVRGDSGCDQVHKKAH